MIPYSLVCDIGWNGYRLLYAEMCFVFGCFKKTVAAAGKIWIAWVCEQLMKNIFRDESFVLRIVCAVYNSIPFNLVWGLLGLSQKPFNLVDGLIDKLLLIVLRDFVMKVLRQGLTRLTIHRNVKRRFQK